MAQEGHLTTYDDDMLNLTRRTTRTIHFVKGVLNGPHPVVADLRRPDNRRHKSDFHSWHPCTGAFFVWVFVFLCFCVFWGA